MAKKLAASDYPAGTRTQTLDRTYIFQGQFYGPGEAEVPDSFPTTEDLAKRNTDAMAPMELGRVKSAQPAEDGDNDNAD